MRCLRFGPADLPLDRAERSAKNLYQGSIRTPLGQMVAGFPGSGWVHESVPWGFDGSESRAASDVGPTRLSAAGTG